MKLNHLFAGTGMVLVLSINPAITMAQSSTESYSYDALGRLITVVSAGGQNNNETHSICYDDAGNRTEFVSNSSGTPASCTEGVPSPPPPPPPPPPNGSPLASDDFLDVACNGFANVNLVANDSDPEGDPLSLVSISRTSGGFANATIDSATSVNVNGDSQITSTAFTYVVSDGNGGTDSARLTVVTIGCDDGLPL